MRYREHSHRVPARRRGLGNTSKPIFVAKLIFATDCQFLPNLARPVAAPEAFMKNRIIALGMLVVVACSAILVAQQTRTEVTKATTPYDDSKPNSDKVPEAYAVRMIDTNHAYGVADAIRLGRALEPLDLRWHEEPVIPEDYAGYREVKSAVNIPIAAGENEHSLYGFRELIGGRCIDIAQPDLGSAGGFTACRHIIALAHAHGVQVIPHVW